MKLPSFLRGGSRSEVSGLENPSVDLIAALVANVDGATSSGVSVTPMKAFRLAAVYACVKVISEALASLPVEISKSDDRGGRMLVLDDSRWDLLNEFPNPEMTGMELFETWIAHALLWGKGYLYIVKNKAGKPLELWPLKPDVTREERTASGRLYYVTELVSGDPTPIPAENVIPIHAPLRISPVMNARDVVASAASAEQYAGRFWANNARPGGIIELPESMDDDEMDEFMLRWRAGHEGLKRSQLVGILTGGATWKEVGIAPGHAQFIETRQFGVREIARLYGVPPHRVGDLEGTINRGSLEQQSIEFVTYTLRGWVVRAEQALRMKLFSAQADTATRTMPKFNVDELMRGDMRSRFEALAIAIQWGYLSRGDARRKIGEPTVSDDQQLEEFLVPLNMIPSSKLDEIDVAGKSKGGGGGPDNKDNGGTGPTTGSDGSTPQVKGLQMFELLERTDPDLADRIRAYAMTQRRELPAGDPDEPDE